MKVELVNIRTIFELTGGRDFNDPEKIESIVVSSIFDLSMHAIHWLFKKRNKQSQSIKLTYLVPCDSANRLRPALRY